jgi:hypothetical protein
MLPLADLFLRAYVWVDDQVAGGAVPIPRRPGPAPACSDAELLTVALVRHLLARPSEAGFLAEVRREREAHALFPHLPAQSEFNRRVRWLWGAFELLRQAVAEAVPADPWQQVDTSALPIKQALRGRHRGPEPRWDGPDGLQPGFGRDAAHGEWFFGFRLAVRTDLGSRLVRAWGIVPAAVDERAVADGLLDGVDVQGLLLDRGFLGREWAAPYQQRGVRAVLAPGRAERRAIPVALRRPVAALRNRVETSLGEITDRLGLARHGAKSFWGLLTRTAATLLAHTLARLAWL